MLVDSGQSSAWYSDTLGEAGATVITGADPCVLPRACKNAVEIVYRDFEGASHEDEVTEQLFGKDAGRKAAENRRWELTENHWDLPIYQVDTTKPR